VPACGGNVEVLTHHGLDGVSIASYVASAFRRTSVDRVRSG
jgi:hypothetical protein